MMRVTRLIDEGNSMEKQLMMRVTLNQILQNKAACASKQCNYCQWMSQSGEAYFPNPFTVNHCLKLSRVEMESPQNVHFLLSKDMLF